jgi:hypothetical protein
MLAGLVATAALAAASPAAAAPRLSLGRLAGYVWDSGQVSSVTATFTVPRIRQRSPAGAVAATWIGAQAPGLNAPFIQIGISEMHYAARNLYYAFWSDTELHYHAAFLLPVHAGDVIAASLRHVHDGWKLAIVDATTRGSVRFFTPDEARGAFNLAEWLQEDVTDGATDAALPYPRLSGGRFQELRVDSQTPDRPSLLSQWLSMTRGYVAPSAISRDAFALHPAKLRRAAGNYLRLIAPEDLAAYAFDAAITRWSVDTPKPQVAAASAAFAAALRRSIGVLAVQRWPKDATGLIRLLIHRLLSVLRVVESAPAAVPAGLAAWTARYRRAAIVGSRTGRMIRRRLHAPAYNI